MTTRDETSLPQTADHLEDLRRPVATLLRDLRTGRDGLGEREAAHRLVVHGPNELRRRQRRTWPADLRAQLTHPLALLLWGAAGLAWLAGTPVLTAAIVGVVLLNAGFAFVQERQAERAVEALRGYLPPQARVLRDGGARAVPARELVPGDVLLLDEGDRVSADARLLAGAVDVDMSALTGEAIPVPRTAGAFDPGARLLACPDLVFSGTLCVSGSARAVVYATGGRTELGRIAALSERTGREPSPLERQVKRVAWLIAAVAVAAGAAFLPLGVVAGLPLSDAFAFAVGLLVANVPEGLLPTITLALAVGVRVLARRGAVVKRLSAVETLGSTTVICTDKTGTLTLNRMRGVALWSAGETRGLADGPPATRPGDDALGAALAACNTVTADADGALGGDPTEVALVEVARSLGARFDPADRDARRRRVFRFDTTLRRMTTVDETAGGLVVSVKGAPESVLARCTTVVRADGGTGPVDADVRAAVARSLDGFAAQGLRVLAVARRAAAEVPERRDAAEAGLTLLGLVALHDPPRPEVPGAVAACHRAGIRVHVVTGDNALTAGHVARSVGIGQGGLHLVQGDELDAMSEAQLDALLAAGGEVVFARSSPEAKLRIADALRHLGHVVAMTGDGVNDAPALRRADIGVAMGVTGTDVAREAATMVLTDDNFATVAAAVEAGRRVFDDVRKFVLYIFAHAVPEVAPFLVFALAGGLVPLPLTVLQILAIDLGTETLPALALGREPAEPGLMDRPPRRRSEGVVTGPLLFRAWAVLGAVSAVLVLGAFGYVLWRAGWSPGDPVGKGHPLHHAYLQATAATFAGIVACQVGTAFAARTDRASLRSIGVLSNPLLLWGIAFELAFAAAVVYLPPLQGVFGTAALPPDVLGVIAPFPLVVWGADEARRALLRRRAAAARPAR